MDDFLVARHNSGYGGNSNIIRVRGAIIEEISEVRNSGYVTISYGVMRDFNTVHMELVTLIVSNSTRIRDRSGRRMRVSNLRVGMVVDAEFSVAMTRSIPPQARAYSITIERRREPSNTTEGRILAVDGRNGVLYTGNVSDRRGQMRFIITDKTRILNRRGNRISLRDLRVGQRVRVEHASFMTPSIPPQTTAFVVRVI